MTDYSLECAQGSFALTGQTTGVLASRKLAIGQGSYTLSGGVRHAFTSGAGSELFAPHTNATETAPWRTTIDSDGVKQDSLTTYGTFGTQRADCTIQGLVKQRDEDGGTGLAHTGLGLRWTDTSNFAVLAMIKPSNGHFQVADKIGGGETTYYDHAVSGGLSYDTWYKIRIELVGSAAVCKLYDASDNLLDSYNHTVAVGTPAIGYPVVHEYDTTGIYGQIEMWDSSGVPIVDANAVFASVYTLEHRAGVFVTSGNIDLYSDGTNGSNNGWMKILTNIQPKNFRMTGSFTYKSGRVCGIAFRQSDNGQTGYEFWYDSNGASSYVRLYKNNMATSLLSTAAATMVADTTYPWTLEVWGNTYSWTINGNTYTHTDTSYSSAGYVGVIGYKSHNYIDFEIAGTDITTQRNLSLAQGSYATAGQTVSTLAGRKLALTQGDYTLFGQDVGFLYARILSLAYGSYALTGQDVDLTAVFFRGGTVTASDTCLYTVTASDMACT